MPPHTHVAQTSDGSKYRGVFSASNVGDADELAVALRVVTTLVDGATGAAPAPHRPATQLVVKGENVVRLEAKGVRLRDDSVVDASEDDAGLGTDAGIARRSKAGEYGRELQAWDGGDVPEDLTLEATFGDEKGGRGRGKRRGGGAGVGAAGAGWNQFEANAKQFGVNTSFDESMYTTQLSQARTAGERAREREAARLAREIQAEAGGTAHQREERGQAQEKDYEDMDEEDKYSSVMAGRTGGAAKGFDRTELSGLGNCGG